MTTMMDAEKGGKRGGCQGGTRVEALGAGYRDVAPRNARRQIKALQRTFGKEPD